jgi:hypothetical protein
MAKLVMDLDVFVPLREEVIKDGGNLQLRYEVAKEKCYEENDPHHDIFSLDAKLSKLFHISLPFR